jgi:oligopeptide/dipeptide ABC transporter ATP-binding protein
LNAYPHELSGGMRQRVMIAIALACRPQVLIADEPTTALDVTVQLQILSLVRELCDKLDMAVLFITHDLGVVSQLANRVAVMYAGRTVETGPVDILFEEPVHPYTAGLMSCVPDPAAGHRRLKTIPGQAPKPGEIPDGCAFVPRCDYAQAACRAGVVPKVTITAEHDARCWFPMREGVLQ